MTVSKMIEFLLKIPQDLEIYVDGAEDLYPVADVYVSTHPFRPPFDILIIK